jgi:hypothetical protein
MVAGVGELRVPWYKSQKEACQEPKWTQIKLREYYRSLGRRSGCFGFVGKATQNSDKSLPFHTLQT